MTRNEAIAKVRAFEQLGDNWDHEGAIAPSVITIDVTVAYILRYVNKPLRQVMATPEGSIRIETADGQVEIEAWT